MFFPEGMRSDDGTIGPFRPGIGLLAKVAGVPVVPVYLKGTDSVIAKGGGRPHRGFIEVKFGEPLRFEGNHNHAEVTRQIRTAVASLSEESVP